MLSVNNLVKTYNMKGEPEVKALNGVSIDLPEHGLVFFLGKSGSGKSTLLNILGGLDAPDEGEIIINGKSSKDFSATDYDGYRNTCVGFVFQEYNLLNEFTVGQNISLALQLQGIKDFNTAVKSALKQVELEGFENRKPNTLSGGQKQRVAIARALVKNPQIILADEPTGALDSETGKDVLETLKKLSNDKLVVVVTHDREFAETYGDRIIELKDGKVIADTQKTKPSKVQTNEKGFTLVRSRLPIARAFKMGAASLKVKPFRLALTILLSFVSFVLFGISSTMMFYSEKAVLVNSYYESDNNYVLLEKGYTYRATDLVSGETWWNENENVINIAPIGNKDIVTLGEMAVGVYRPLSSSVDNVIVIDSDYYYPGVRYLSILPEGHALRDKLLEGRYPTSADEICVSSYLLACAQNGQFYPVDDNGVMQQTPLTVSSAKELVGQRLSAFGGTFTISGVFDSGEIPSLYDPLKTAIDSDEELSGLGQNFRSNYLPESLSQLALVTKDFYFQNRKALERAPFARFHLNYFDDVHYEYDFYDSSTNSNCFTGLYFRVYENNPTYSQLPVTFLRGYENLKELTGNQFIINSQSLLHYYMGIFYKGEHTPEEQAKFDAFVAATEALNSYSILAYDNPSDAERAAAHEIILQYVQDNPISITIKRSSYDSEDISLGFAEIVGFYDNCDTTGTGSGNSNGMYCSKSFYDSARPIAAMRSETNYVPDPEADFLAVLVPFSSRADLEKIANLTDKNFETDVFYRFDGSIADNVRNVSYYVELMWQIFLWTGLALALLAALLLFNFITMSISNKKKEIGILRAVGARGIDVFKIFFAESGIIVGSCITLALIGTLVLAIVLNSVMKSLFYLEVTLFVFGLPSILLMIGVAVVVAVVSTFLPVYFAARKKPVDSIRAL